MVARASDGSEAVVVASAGSRDVRLELPGVGSGTVIGFKVLEHVLIAGERHRSIARLDRGAFEARNLPPGLYRVHAVAGGESDAVEATVEAGGVARVELRRGSSGRVAGVVRALGSHETIAGAACGWSAPGMVEDFARVASDEEGRFVLDVPAGREGYIYCSVENGLGSRRADVAAGTSRAVEIPVYSQREHRRAYAGLSLREGVVTEVRPEAGPLRAGDRMLIVDGIDVSSLDESMVEMILNDDDPGVPYARLTSGVNESPVVG